jgi:hypothetical protein
MIKKQIEVVVIVADLHFVLASDKRESLPKFLCLRIYYVKRPNFAIAIQSVIISPLRATFHNKEAICFNIGGI